jgi:hypothetical protein
MVAVQRLGVAIPEIGVARGQLENIYDFQFGMCTNTFDGVLDLMVQEPFRYFFAIVAMAGEDAKFRCL